MIDKIDMYNNEAKVVYSYSEAAYKIVDITENVSALYIKSGLTGWKRVKKGQRVECFQTILKWAGIDEAPAAINKIKYTEGWPEIRGKDSTFFNSLCKKTGVYSGVYRLVQNGEQEWLVQNKIDGIIQLLTTGTYDFCINAMHHDANLYSTFFDNRINEVADQYHAVYEFEHVGTNKCKLRGRKDLFSEWDKSISGTEEELLKLLVPFNLDDEIGRRTKVRNTPSTCEFKLINPRGQECSSYTLARYKLHKMTTGLWRISRKNEKTGRFNMVAEGKIEDMVAAMDKMIEASYEYFSIAGSKSRYKAIARVSDMSNHQYVMELKENGTWVDKASGSYDNVMKAVETALSIARERVDIRVLTSQSQMIY